MMSCTPRQADCLKFIAAHIAEKGFAPSYRQIADAIGLKSKSGAFRMICELERRGRLRRVKSHVRCLEIVAEEGCPHCGYPLGSDECRKAAANKITYSRSPGADSIGGTGNSTGAPRKTPRAAAGGSVPAGAG